MAQIHMSHIKDIGSRIFLFESSIMVGILFELFFDQPLYMSYRLKRKKKNRRIQGRKKYGKFIIRRDYMWDYKVKEKTRISSEIIQ